MISPRPPAESLLTCIPSPHHPPPHCWILPAPVATLPSVLRRSFRVFVFLLHLIPFVTFARKPAGVFSLRLASVSALPPCQSRSLPQRFLGSIKFLKAQDLKPRGSHLSQARKKKNSQRTLYWSSDKHHVIIRSKTENSRRHRGHAGVHVRKPCHIVLRA